MNARVKTRKIKIIKIIIGINTWAHSLVRYSELFLKWTREEFKQMDQRTRKLMTTHNTLLHPRYEVNRRYVPRKEGGRGLTSIDDDVDASIQRLEDYIQNMEKD